MFVLKYVRFKRAEHPELIIFFNRTDGISDHLTNKCCQVVRAEAAKTNRHDRKQILIYKQLIHAMNGKEKTLVYSRLWFYKN